MYKLPDFHLTMDFYKIATLTPLVVGAMISAGVSCQLVGRGGALAIIKCPKGTNLPIGQQVAPAPGVIANIPAGSNDWYEVTDYVPTALGYPNEHETYDGQYANAKSTLPHS